MARTNRSIAVLIAALSVFAGVMAVASPAAAHRTITMYEYLGEHPVPDGQGNWCVQEEVHVHKYRLDPEKYLVYETDSTTGTTTHTPSATSLPTGAYSRDLTPTGGDPTAAPMNPVGSAMTATGYGMASTTASSGGAGAVGTPHS